MIARWCSGLTAACVVSAAFLAGCSSTTATSAATGTNNGASTSASKSAACKSAEDLKASIAGLKNMNIRANGTSALSDQVVTIQQDLEKFKANAHGQFSAQVTDLTNALNTMESKLNAAKSSMNAGTLTALASAAGAVVTAGTNLVTAATNAC
jgi:hypothetical protein